MERDAMPEPKRLEQVYILRLWKEPAAGCNGQAVWRFSLEDPVTRQRRGFADLEMLTAFLEEQVQDAR